MSDLTGIFPPQIQASSFWEVLFLDTFSIPEYEVTNNKIFNVTHFDSYKTYVARVSKSGAENKKKPAKSEIFLRILTSETSF